MSAKARFMKKLQEQQPRSRVFDSKSQADIAEFCERMNQLQETMESWLTGTGINIETMPVSVLDAFAGNHSFTVPAIALRYGNRMMKFTPVFLYGQGVTGGIEVTLCSEGRITPLYRLFMRSGEDANWSFSTFGRPAAPRTVFSENAFFDMISVLLPE